MSSSPAILQRAYTLIELLITIVIIGVIASLLVISVKTVEGSKSLETWLKHFRETVIYAQDAAVLSNKNLAIQFNIKELRFLKQQNGKWQPHNDDMLRNIALPEGAASNLFIDGVNLLKDNEFEENRPDILVDYLGTMTPFELQLTNEEKKLIIKYDASGDMTHEIQK